MATGSEMSTRVLKQVETERAGMGRRRFARMRAARDTGPTVRIITRVVLAGFLFCGAICCAAAGAQSERPARVAASELGQENMSLVAASPEEIKTVLGEDPGLMVELKRWVAKDATDHGQIIGEADLTDDAIYSRVERDVQFRAVATELVQRYGYLSPKVNPESAAGKEQEMLIAERAKWIAQDEEEA